MKLTLIERILANKSGKEAVEAGEIVDVSIDARVARDFGGANVVKNLVDHGLNIDDAEKTFFTFDTNPGGSDQKYAANQQFCRQYARSQGIRVFDIDTGIGTHQAIDKGMVSTGGTLVSTDSHANILGAIGAFGQGMGDKDIAAVWARGKAWFKVPESVKLIFEGELAENIAAKDIVLNLLSIFGANKLLGYSVEIYGDAVDRLTLDERITIASMATEMGAIIILFTPNNQILKELESLSGLPAFPIFADDDAHYKEIHHIDVSKFKPMVALPGHPHNDTGVDDVKGTKIDSAFIGSCTNGRMSDLRIAASILKNRHIAPGVVLKIVPSTDAIWQEALDEGLIKIFKDSGALVSNAGCAGCAAGQIGQNGPGEITISTGNRNFAGKQGKGEVYLASPAVVAASAVAGFITTSDTIPDVAMEFDGKGFEYQATSKEEKKEKRPSKVKGRIWLIEKDDIDTDMIFHNRYLSITDIELMGQYTFDNLEGYENFAKEVKEGDLIFTAKNFGAGSSRQQAVDCFTALGVQCIVAESFGAIYERNAINAAFPILTYDESLLAELELKNGNEIELDFIDGSIINHTNGKSGTLKAFSDVQKEIFERGGLLG